jgi:hypothetical protein
MEVMTLDGATITMLLLTAAVTCMFLWGAVKADPGGNSPFVASLVLALWMAYTALMAGMGLLLVPDSMPAPFARIMAPGLVLVAIAAFSRFGKRLADRLSFAVLVGFHGFRLPLELLLWWLHRQGRLPVQMIFEGRNPDILTGVSAIVMAVLLKRGVAGKKAVMIWNVAGFALLLNIMAVAILSLPGRMRAFKGDPANTIVLHFPYVWVPAIFVLAAFLGHLVLFRKIRATR